MIAFMSTVPPVLPVLVMVHLPQGPDRLNPHTAFKLIPHACHDPMDMIIYHINIINFPRGWLAHSVTYQYE